MRIRYWEKNQREEVVNRKNKHMKNRGELEKAMNEKIAKLKALCNDAHYSDKLINDILLIKAQLDIEPTYIHIPTKSVAKDESGKDMEYNFGHFSLIKTKTCIIFGMNGFKLLVFPWIQTLYQHLEGLMYWHSVYEKLTEEEKENYYSLLNATMVILMNPATCFSDDEYWLKQSTYLTKMQNELFTRLLETPLQDEDVVANEQFRQEIEMVQGLQEELKKSEDGGNKNTEE